MTKIWFLPESKGLQPGYEQKHYTPEEKREQLKLVASRNGRDGSVSLNQDVDMYACLLNGEEMVSHDFALGRKGYLQVARGSVVLNGELLRPGDGAKITGGSIELSHGENAEVILFDMAPLAA